MLTPHQQSILAFVREKGGQVKKSEVVERFGHWHYRNSEKHIGDALSRMVRAGLLKRVSIGIYEYGIGTKQKPAVIATDVNQTTLF